MSLPNGFVDGALEITVNERTVFRSFVEHIPTWADEYNPVPLIMIFHDKADDTIEARNLMAEYWVHRTNEVAMVCLEAGFNAVSGVGTWGHDLETDLLFVDELLAQYEAMPQVKVSCAYAVGFGAGAKMVWELATHEIAQHRFIGFGAVSAAMEATHLTSDMEFPKPAIYIHGTFAPNWSRMPPRTTAYWVRRNLCKGVPDNNLLDARNDAIAAIKQTFLPGLAKGAAFEFITVLNGGHSWPFIPGVNPSIQQGSSTTCTDFSATDEIMTFFNKYARCP